MPFRLSLIYVVLYSTADQTRHNAASEAVAVLSRSCSTTSGCSACGGTAPRGVAEIRENVSSKDHFREVFAAPRFSKRLDKTRQASLPAKGALTADKSQ